MTSPRRHRRALLTALAYAGGIVVMAGAAWVKSSLPVEPPRPAVTTPPPDAPAKLYGGRTVDEWLVLIKKRRAEELGRPELVSGMTDLVADDSAPWEARRHLALSLGRIGAPAQPAVPALAALLHNEEFDAVNTQLWALKSLGLMGLPAESATSAVAAVALDPEQPYLIRAAAMETLAYIGARTAVPVTTLIALLASDRRFDDSRLANELRMSAAVAVGILGPDGIGAAPELLRGLRSDSPLLRLECARALGSIGPRAEIAIDPLTEILLADAAGAVREAAADALANLGAGGRRRLIELLGAMDGETQSLAIRGLQNAAPDRDVQSALAAALQHDNENVRVRVAAILVALPQPPPGAVDALVNGISSEDRSLRKLAYETLRDGSPEIYRSRRDALSNLLESESVPDQTRTAARGLLRLLDVGT